MRAEIRPALVLLVLFTILTGVAYPLAVTGIAQIALPGPADGSWVRRDGRIVGSRLIGQPFDDARYFWGRLSATAPFPYNPELSTGSNLGPMNPALIDAAKKRLAALRGDSTSTMAVPVDLATASGSGLDPEISPAAAEFQVERVAHARGMPADQVRALVKRHTQGRTLGMLGEPRVNVLELNLVLDEGSTTK